MKKIALITGTEKTMLSLKGQLENYLSDIADIDTYISDYGIKSTITADLTVISSELIYDDVKQHLSRDSRIIMAKRVINFSELEKILYIEDGEEVLVVNDVAETTIECIEWLKRLGLDKYHYIPFYQGCEAPEKIRYAITPGETELVPANAEEVIDIGPRIIDMTTLTEILKELDIFEENWDKISMIYLNKIIESSKRLVSIGKEKTKAYENLLGVIDKVDEGILCFDSSRKITVINENLKVMLGIKSSRLIGKNIKQVFSGGILEEILDEKYIDRTVEYKGRSYRMSKLEIDNAFNFITFKNLENNKDDDYEIKKELYRKGYFAKYAFEDIVGESDSLVRVKTIAKKLAKADLTVLIEGESGTGKELFASAIHNASERRNKPFVAVNFSALSETLVESELFGYEEGAFTGAVKGGKAGLFEQADGGTIFLDEVGDISPKVQSRLLRVLQEKELMRVGGSKIISIDVRVIAATNQNLYQRVQEGSFRTDLYHRLKVLYLKLPALRERKGDIEKLLHTFLDKKGRSGIAVDDAVIEKLLLYPWRGNVRELGNTIDYMLAVCEGERICEEDLPEESFFIETEIESDKSKPIEELGGRKDLIFILKELYKKNIIGQTGTRANLLKAADKAGLSFTEQTLRKRLDELEVLGYLLKNRGKGGTKLSERGMKMIGKYIES